MAISTLLVATSEVVYSFYSFTVLKHIPPKHAKISLHICTAWRVIKLKQRPFVSHISRFAAPSALTQHFLLAAACANPIIYKWEIATECIEYQWIGGIVLQCTDIGVIAIFSRILRQRYFKQINSYKHYCM